MMFWSALSPSATLGKRGHAVFTLALLAALPAAAPYAEEAAKATSASAKTVPSPAKPAPHGKTEIAAKPAPAPAPVAVVKPKPGTLFPAECIRTGQRVIAALARDDSGAASQFHNFYTAFKCSPTHLAQSFGCLVTLQTSTPGLSNPSPEQVSLCWDNPSEPPKVPAPPPPPPAQPTQEPPSEKK
jgi:hypothetical protein